MFLLRCWTICFGILKVLTPFFHFVSECFPWMYVCAPLACLVPLEVEKEPWNPVELQLGMVMNHSGSDGTQALVLCKGKKCY